MQQVEQLKTWLKSIKERYTCKPSDEQMELLKEACDKRWEPDGLDPLYILYQDLKKLKNKVMKAPEKIYLYPSDRAGEEYEDEWGSMPWGEGYVEYTRTDVFIEKAVKHIDGLIEFLNEFGHQLKKERIIEDFKKYMED